MVSNDVYVELWSIVENIKFFFPEINFNVSKLRPHISWKIKLGFQAARLEPSGILEFVPAYRLDWQKATDSVGDQRKDGLITFTKDANELEIDVQECTVYPGVDCWMSWIYSPSWVTRREWSINKFLGKHEFLDKWSKDPNVSLWGSLIRNRLHHRICFFSLYYENTLFLEISLQVSMFLSWALS